jgi:hypothetical protein
MTVKSETIYVAVTNRPPGSCVPVQAHRRANGVFQIISRNDDPEDELWEFQTGSLVRCREVELAGHTQLLAVEAVPEPRPRLVT